MVPVTMAAIVVRVLQVVAGGAERLEDDGGGFRREDGAELVIEVAGRTPSQPAHGPGPVMVSFAHPPVRMGEALELARGHRRGHRDKIGLGFRGDDPG